MIPGWQPPDQAWGMVPRIYMFPEIPWAFDQYDFDRDCDIDGVVSHISKVIETGVRTFAASFDTAKCE